VKAGKPFSFITDHLGSPSSAFDAAGTRVWDASVSLYGEQLNRVGDPAFCPFRFPGQYEDSETGLLYNYYRYYDPQSGIYLSQDPIGLLGGNRPYSYVGNPTLDVDPFGLAPGDSAALDRALGGTVGDAHQAHHLIPCQVWDNNQALFDDLGMERNAASNGLLMPSDAAIQGSRVGHVGSHPKYNQLVANEVDSIRTALGDGLITRGEAREMLDDLQIDLSRRIRSRDPSIPVTASKTNPCKLA
jgi:RHS repeat-associated protein